MGLSEATAEPAAAKDLLRLRKDLLSEENLEFLNTNGDDNNVEISMPTGGWNAVIPYEAKITTNV